MFFGLFKTNLRPKYVADQMGIMSRYLNEKPNWNEHIQYTKKFILNHLPSKSPLKIAVLGSGWLIDFPMEELVNEHEIFLFDICHPKSLKHKYRKNRNVFFIEQDLTFGLVDAIHKMKGKDSLLNFINQLKPTIDLSLYQVVISLNLLNQLDILLIDNSHLKNLPENELLAIREKIQDNHVNCMPKGKSILISDWVEINYSKNKPEPIEKDLIFTKVFNDLPFEKWNWEFDTHGKYHQKFNTTFQVRAFSF